jgi:magnesium-protoporphyrin O-methyltransferase
MACCSFDETVDAQFGARKAANELDRYRRRGAGATARMLLCGLAQAGPARGSLLDVGGGVGALTFALLDRGVERAVLVEASRAYANAARAEAERSGQAAAVELVRGDFVDVARRVAPATIVTLDRVVCCYPLYGELLAEAVGHAERLFAYSYPRDRWYVRAMVGLENVMRRRRSRFRTFVHPEAAMRRLIESAGFTRVSHAHTLAWAGDVFVRVGSS